MSEGLSVTHRRYVPWSHAHYGGALVDGAYVLGLFGDAATELCIRTDGDEGLFAGYSSVEFLRPLHAGDFVEVRATITRSGSSSRDMAFELVRYARPRRDISDSAADLVEGPELAARATGTCVVPVDRQRRRAARDAEGSGS